MPDAIRLPTSAPHLRSSLKASDICSPCAIKGARTRAAQTPPCRHILALHHAAADAPLVARGHARTRAR